MGHANTLAEALSHLQVGAIMLVQSHGRGGAFIPPAIQNLALFNRGERAACLIVAGMVPTSEHYLPLPFPSRWRDNCGGSLCKSVTCAAEGDRWRGPSAFP